MVGPGDAEAASWIARQTCWRREGLRRMGQLPAERLAPSGVMKNLEAEVDDLSLHLSTSYEEISLLYRLTQNLKLSSTNEELASLAHRLAGRRAACRVAGLAVDPCDIADRARKPRREPFSHHRPVPARRERAS